MAQARRALTALVAFAGLVGLSLTIVGAWFAIVLGPSGTATFSVTASEPLLITQDTLNRLDVPATVTARADSGSVFLGRAVPQDALDAVGRAKHEEVVAAQLPGRSLSVSTSGSGVLADPSASHVWRARGQSTLVVSHENAPESVLVVPALGGRADVTVTWKRSVWFLESIAALVVGLVLLVPSGRWLWQHRGELRARGADPADGVGGAGRVAGATSTGGWVPADPRSQPVREHR